MGRGGGGGVVLAMMLFPCFEKWDSRDFGADVYS